MTTITTPAREDAIVAAALELTNATRNRDNAIKDATKAAKVADDAHRRAAAEQANFNEARDYAERMRRLMAVALQNYEALLVARNVERIEKGDSDHERADQI